MPWSTWTTRSPAVSAPPRSMKSWARARLARGRDQPVAQNVLLGDDREIGRLETCSMPQTARRAPASRLRQHGQRLDERAPRPASAQAVVGQHMAEPLARASDQAATITALAVALAAPGYASTAASNTLALRVGALGARSCGPARAPQSTTTALAGRSGCAKGVSRDDAAPRPARSAHSVRREIERVRRQRLVGRRRAGDRPSCRASAGVVIIRDLRQALARRLARPAGRSTTGAPGNSRTACRAARRTAAANVRGRDSGGLR